MYTINELVDELKIRKVMTIEEMVEFDGRTRTTVRNRMSIARQKYNGRVIIHYKIGNKIRLVDKYEYK